MNKGKDFIFNYNNQEITVIKEKNSKGNKMEIGKEKLLNINQFIDNFNNPEIKNLIQQSESVETNEKKNRIKMTKNQVKKKLKPKIQNLQM